jgi:acyl carrier protein
VNDAAIRAGLLAALKAVAPEVEEGELRPQRPLRKQVDLDSMDWLNFLLAVHERFKLEIPESDYERLSTLDDLVKYIGDGLRRK